MIETAIFTWIILALVPAILAANKGRSAFGWFLIALIISPLIALLFVAVMSNRRTEIRHGKECPMCAETVQRRAKVCKHCGHALA